MSAADLQTLRELAQLARLSLGADELERFAPELERILAAFEVLASHTPGNPPMRAAAASRTREDEPVPSLPRAELLAAASASADGFFVVPKTVGNEG